MNKEQADKMILQIAEWITNTNQSEDVARKLATLLLEESKVDGLGGCLLCQA